ncbi:unnamed protein product [Rotaria sordida]|uniref:HMA domain-containing protein n=1 Tax=Rotaria sordida TaxID=392033 RepID=A0A818Z3U3_9BILA|nr:unnamed protein product [Rotaria sordida]CAF3764301.1 unnamed protein product [Rotaria sordida]
MSDTDTASNAKQNVQQTVAKIQDNLSGILSISDMWVQMAVNKIQYENSERREEIAETIQTSGRQFEQLAIEVECAGQLFKELNLEFIFQVNGITSQSSGKIIERNVGKMNGVKLVKVLLNENEAHVEFDHDKTTEQAIIDVIGHLGFQAQVK